MTDVVRQKGSPFWYARFSLNGVITNRSTKTKNRAHALKKAREIRDEVYAQQELGDKLTITVHDALHQYLDSESKSGEQRNIERVVRKMLGSKLDHKDRETVIKVYGFDGDANFHTLSDADVQKLILARRREGNADGTILIELVRLSKAIKLVGKLGYAVPTIDFKGLKDENGVKPAKKRLRYLDKTEEDALLAALAAETTHSDVSDERSELRDFVIALLDLGGRWNEIAQLKWSAIDLDCKTIALWRGKVKNESVMTITDRLLEVLKRRLDSKRDNQVYVFEDSTHTTHRKYTPRGFKSACKRAGIDHVSPHVLRKTFASKLVKAGAPIYGVSKLLGHASVTTTASYYSHLSPNEASVQAVEILNKLNK